MSKVNKISLILEIEGKGLVNYNGDRPPKRYLGQMIHNGKVVKTGSFGKENLYLEEVVDSDGKKTTIEVSKKKISDNLLRKEIMGDENSVNAHKLSTIQSLRIAYISQDNVIARGFMYAPKNDKEKEKELSFKRKGAIIVTAAEQTSGTVCGLETRTREGERDENSLHFKETCGSITYQSEIIFDIKQMHFISIDDNYDRMSMTEKDVPGFIKHIDSRYGEGNAVFGNWGTTHLNVIGEQGVLLSPKVVSNIVREVIKGVLAINITRAGSYAKTSGVKISLGYEGDDIDLLAKPKFVNINSISDYDKMVGGVEIGVEFLPIEPPVIEKKEKKTKEDN